MSDGMNRSELIREIRRLHRLLAVAARKTAAQYAMIDKITAALLTTQRLLRKLERQRPTGGK